MQNCETSPGPPSEAICGRDFVKDIEPQRIYIRLQFSRVANILQPSRWRVSEEIQAICQFFAWPRFPCICCWARMARLAAHFVVNLEQIEVNIFPLFTPLPSFLLLLSQTAHGNLEVLTYYFYYFFWKLRQSINASHQRFLLLPILKLELWISILNNHSNSNFEYHIFIKLMYCAYNCNLLLI